MVFEIAIDHRIGERHLRLALASKARLTALVGPSGAGKSTVLNCVGGLLRPDSGRIAVAGRTLFDSATGLSLRPEARHAGYVFQDARLFPHLTVAVNLAYGERLARDRPPIIDRDHALDLLGVGDLMHRWPATLSGGEVRRVAIGRALLAAPAFLLLDEPMASLDAPRAEGIRQLIERLRDELAVPMLLVSHDVAEVDRLAGEVVRLG